MSKITFHRTVAVVALLVVSVTSQARHLEPPSATSHRVTETYFNVFQITNSYSGYTTAETIKNPYAKTMLTSDQEQNYLYKYLDSKGCKGRINKNDIHLLVPAQNGKPEYQVDSEGAVKRGREEYVLKPSAFLHLSDLMINETEYVKVHDNK